MKTEIRGGIKYAYCKKHKVWWNTEENFKCPVCLWGKPYNNRFPWHIRKVEKSGQK
jgi:hypothetical protein